MSTVYCGVLLPPNFRSDGGYHIDGGINACVSEIRISGERKLQVVVDSECATAQPHPMEYIGAANILAIFCVPCMISTFYKHSKNRAPTWAKKKIGEKGDLAIVHHLGPALSASPRPIDLQVWAINLSTRAIPSLIDAILFCPQLGRVEIWYNPDIEPGHVALKQAFISRVSPASSLSLRPASGALCCSATFDLTPKDILAEGIAPDPALQARAQARVDLLNSFSETLVSMHIEMERTMAFSLGLVAQHGISTIEVLQQAPDTVFLECGFSKPEIALVRQAKPADPGISQLKTFLLFLSYVKRDTVAETGLVAKVAKEKWPEARVFLDTEEHFELSQLVANVKQAKNVIIFLSEHYAESPYCVVEMVTAVEAGAKICGVLVDKPGLGRFDFERVNALIKSGDVSALMDQRGWDVVATQGISKLRVLESLKKIINVKAFDLHMNVSDRVRKAELEDIFDGIVV